MHKANQKAYAWRTKSSHISKLAVILQALPQTQQQCNF